MALPFRPGNADRGWNDPPEFLHDISGGTVEKAPRRNLLNKRVAYDFEAKATPTATSATEKILDYVGISGIINGESYKPPVPAQENVVLLPPSSSIAVSHGISPIIVPNMDATSGAPVKDLLADEIQNPDFSNDDQFFHYVTSKLKKVLRDCSPSMQKRIVDDIDRKLKVFETMWESSKISYPVKVSMGKLANALHQRKCDIAHEIHLSLMMDYVPEVGPWMVAVKRLIHEARSVEAPMSPGCSPVGSPQTTTAGEELPHLEVEKSAAQKPLAQAGDELPDGDNL